MIIIPKTDDLAKLASPKGYLYRVTGDEKLVQLTKSNELISNYFMSTSPDSFILYHAYYYEFDGDKIAGSDSKLCTKRVLLVNGVSFAVDLIKEPSWWQDRDTAGHE